MKINTFQAVLWTFGAYVTLGFCLVIAVSISPSVQHDPVPLAAILSAVYLATCSLFAGRRPGRTWSETFAMRRTSVWLVLFALILGVLVCLPAHALAVWVTHFWPIPEADRMEPELPLTLARAIALFLFSAGIGPFAEELLFRGALYTGLRPAHAPVSAAWTTSVLFTLTHLQPRNWLAILLVAVLLGAVRAVSGSLWPSVFLHAAFNATALAMDFLPHRLKNPSPALVLGCIPAAAVVLGIIVWIARASASADRARRVDLEPDPGLGGETDP